MRLWFTSWFRAHERVAARWRNAGRRPVVLCSPLRLIVRRILRDYLGPIKKHPVKLRSARRSPPNAIRARDQPSSVRTKLFSPRSAAPRPASGSLLIHANPTFVRSRADSVRAGAPVSASERHPVPVSRIHAGLLRATGSKAVSHWWVFPDGAGDRKNPPVNRATARHRRGNFGVFLNRRGDWSRR